MRRLLRYSFFIGLALVLFVVLRIDLSGAATIISGARPSLLLLAFLMVLAEIYLKGLKLKTLASTHAAMSTRDALVTYLVGITYGVVTPGQVGDFGKVFTMRKKTGLGATRCLSVVFVERLLELFFLLLLAALGLLVILSTWGIEGRAVAFLGTLLVGILALLGLVNRDIMVRPFRMAYRLVLPPQFHEGANSRFADFYAGVSQVMHQRGKLLFAALLVGLWWLLAFVQMYLLALAMDIPIGLFYIAVFIPVLSVVELMPISIMGVGTREYAAMVLFSTVGLTQEQSVAWVFTAFLISLLPQALVGYGLVVREQLPTPQTSPTGPEQEEVGR